jgi:hypothetical protein
MLTQVADGVWVRQSAAVRDGSGATLLMSRTINRGVITELHGLLTYEMFDPFRTLAADIMHDTVH